MFEMIKKTDQELLDRLKEIESLVTPFDTIQQALKILINSVKLGGFV